LILVSVMKLTSSSTASRHHSTLFQFMTISSTFFTLTIKPVDNVTHLGGDNASVCIRVCQLSEKPYDPCCSHLQNLETNGFMAAEPILMRAKDAVRKLMKLGTKQTVAPAIAEISDVGAVLPAATRWSSNQRVFAWYDELKDAIREIPELRNAAPTDKAVKKGIKLANEIFSVQKSYCLKMQSGGVENEGRAKRKGEAMLPGADPAKCNLSVARMELKTSGLAYEWYAENYGPKMKNGRLEKGFLELYKSKYSMMDSPIVDRPVTSTFGMVSLRLLTRMSTGLRRRKRRPYLCLRWRALMRISTT
jgi:hypothetical protein